jgi:hypothetical protein
LLPNLHILSTGDGLIVEDINILHTLSFEVSFELLAPLSEELIAAAEHCIGLLSGIELLTHQVVLHLGLCSDIGHLRLEFVVSFFEFEHIFLAVIDKLR